MTTNLKGTNEIAAGRMIVLFDGVCNLCNGAVNFIIDRDPAGAFQFASLQSDIGQELLRQHGIDSNESDSIVLIEEGRTWVRSAAALRITRRLWRLWPALYAFVIVPKPLRDFVYRGIAQRRFKWFGRRETCRLPTPEEQGRFLG